MPPKHIDLSPTLISPGPKNLPPFPLRFISMASRIHSLPGPPPWRDFCFLRPPRNANRQLGRLIPVLKTISSAPRHCCCSSLQCNSLCSVHNDNSRCATAAPGRRLAGDPEIVRPCP